MFSFSYYKGFDCICFATDANFWQISNKINFKIDLRQLLRVVQKLPRYFHGAAIYASAIQSILLSLVNLDLNLNDVKPSFLSSGSSLKCGHNSPGVFEYVWYIALTDTLTLRREDF